MVNYKVIEKVFEILRTNHIDEIKIENLEQKIPIFLMPFQVRCLECYFNVHSNSDKFLEKIKAHEDEEFEIVIK